MGPVVGPHENWQGIKPWVNTADQYKFDGSVRGSAGGINYFLSGEYSYEGGIFSDQPNGNDSKMASFRTNVSFQPLTTLNIAATSSYAHRFTNWVQSGDNRYGAILNFLRSPLNYVNGDDALVFNQRTTSLDDHFVGGITATYNPIPLLPIASRWGSTGGMPPTTGSSPGTMSFVLMDGGKSPVGGGPPSLRTTWGPGRRTS